MDSLLTLFAYMIPVVIIAIMFFDHVQGKVEAASARNLALLGFAMFLVISAPVVLKVTPGNPYNLMYPSSTMTKWMMWCAVFLVVFLAAYAAGFGVPRLVALAPTPRNTPNDSTLFAMAIILTVIAAPLQFGVRFPYIGILAGWMATAFCAVSAGMIGWVWSKRLLNPTIAIPAVIIVLIDAVLGQWGDFGRRSLLSVGAAMLWGMYYGHIRYLPVQQQIVRMGMLAIPPIIAMGLFTSVRNHSDKKSAAIFIKSVTQGDAVEGLSEVTTQNAANIGMWVMEQESLDRIEHRHLFSLGYFFMHPAPRAGFTLLGTEKPWPLSTMTADLANRKGVKRGHTGVTNPAGIVGNAAVEGGLYALIVYAIVGALLLRVFDELVRRNITNPLVVLPAGAALGQTIGLARGETSVFAFIMVFSSVASVVCMIVVGKFLDRVAPQIAAADLDQFGTGEWQEEDYEWYGEVVEEG